MCILEKLLFFCSSSQLSACECIVISISDILVRPKTELANKAGGDATEGNTLDASISPTSPYSVALILV